MTVAVIVLAAVYLAGAVWLWWEWRHAPIVPEEPAERTVPTHVRVLDRESGVGE